MILLRLATAPVYNWQKVPCGIIGRAESMPTTEKVRKGVKKNGYLPCPYLTL
jgi:hypothetical protein